MCANHFAAAPDNDPEGISASLQSGADINGTDPHGRMAIMVVAVLGHKNFVASYSVRGRVSMPGITKDDARERAGCRKLVGD